MRTIRVSSQKKEQTDPALENAGMPPAAPAKSISPLDRREE